VHRYGRHAAVYVCVIVGIVGATRLIEGSGADTVRVPAHVTTLAPPPVGPSEIAARCARPNRVCVFATALP